MSENDAAVRILSAAVSGEGIQGAARAAYELTGLPVSVLDPLLRPLAFYGPDVRPEDCRRFDSGPDDRKRWMDTMRRSGGPRIDSEGGGPYRALCVDACAGKKALAKVAFFETRPFQENDENVIRVFADVVACLLQGKRENADAAQEEELSALLGGLVRGEIGEDEVDEVLAHFPLRGETRLRMAALREKSGNAMEYDMIQMRLRQSCHAIVIQKEDMLIALMETNERQAGEPLEEIAAYYQLHIGVSRDFSGLRYARAYYLQAEFAMRQAEKAQRDIVRYDECMLEDVIALCRKERSLTTYCRPEILKLAEYDVQNETDYAGTFRCYCENLCNMAQTARTSFLHYNTIKYRLKMVEAITGISTVSARDLCEFLLTYEMMDVQNA